MCFDRERGEIDVSGASGSVSIKGPLTKCILPCSTLVSSQGIVRMVFGLPAKTIGLLINNDLQDRIYCESNTILSNLGVSRLFAGCECKASDLCNVRNELILDGNVYKKLEGDNLLDFPSEVVFVGNGERSSLFLYFIML